MDYTEPPSQPNSKQEPDFVSARARRRRAQRRAFFPTDEEGRAALLADLARRAFPTYELFVFALIAGVILGLGYFFDSQGLLIFGMLVAPLLTPWIGISLAIVAGAGRLFTQTLSAIIISSLLIFVSGALAGFATHITEPRTFNEAFVHSRLWWPDLFLLAIGSIIITMSFVRSEERPYLPSALIAYELFLPLCAAGFGLGSGVSHVWPQGMLVFLVHFAWATLFCILTLFFLRFHPTSLRGFTFSGIMLIVLIAWLASSTGATNWMMTKTGLSTPKPDPVIQTTPTLPIIASITPSPSLDPVTAIIGVPTMTPTKTPSPTQRTTLTPVITSTSTITAEPTPIIGLIKAAEGGGAFIREKPGGKVLATLGNGSTVIIIPNELQEVNKVIWVHVFTIRDDVRVEGWMIQSVLVTATPIANWQPSSTPATTSTP